MAVDAQGRAANRLIHEKSPYLLQHAYNPVDWYPWGPEAFAKAKQEEKPVMLSVGYSTCYWCHVMEQESFDDPEIAKLMRETVVAIKVDREERPDIDALYMSAVQAMTGSGGWPMTVFLTHDGKPFYGGTYFPPEDRWGRPGFKTVLRSVAEAWKTRRGELVRSGQSLAQAIQASAGTGSSTPLTTALLESTVQQLAQQYDPTHGGFGSAPKFPRSHTLSFLLRAWTRNRDPQTLAMVETTLDAMARGGIHDHVGGGFHRYSTDPQWLVPHFEKMLYDQALLARTYLEAYQVTGKAEDADVARGVFEYALRDMRDPQGAFYSAEDAGEVGKEGEYYVWTPQEIEQALGAEEAALFTRFYGVTPGGNFSAPAHDSRGGSANQFGGEHGATILSISTPLDAFTEGEGLPPDQVRARLAAARATLLDARSRRERPHRDDKVLTDWNGLMIGALAYGARVLDEPRYAEAAREAARFLLERMQADGRPFDSAQGALLHRYRDGEAAIPAFLDDYAFLAWGLTDLYETTFEARWLAEAVRLTKEMVRLFWDDARGGFSFSGERNEPLIAKTKELYDGALPSGNSVAALNLVRLGLLTTDRDLQGYAERQLSAFSGQASQAPVASPQFLIAVDFWLGPSREIVVAGEPAAADTRQMIRTIHTRFLPRAVLALHPTDETAGQIEALAPFLSAQQPIQGKATAYVCERHICQLPTTELSQLITLLETRP